MSRTPRANALALLLAAALTARAALARASDPSASGGVTGDDSSVERATTRSQIALDVSPPDSPVVPLLRAELSALELDVVDPPPAGGAKVTIHVVLTSESLEVHIVDEATGRTTVREVFSGNGQQMDSRTAVLHTVELLRWHLRSHAASSAASVEPAPALAARPERGAGAEESPVTDARFSLLPMAAYSPGGTRLGLGGELDLLLRWQSFGARLLGASSFVPNRMSVPEGSIEVTSGWGGLEAVAILAAPSSTSLELGAGAALFGSSLRGTANADNLGRDDHVLGLAPLGELRVRQRITHGFALTLASACLVPLRSSRLRVLDCEVGRYGQAVLTLGLGLELRVF